MHHHADAAPLAALTERPDVIPPWNWEVLEPIDGITSMLELGNKRWGKRTPYKPYFEGLGIRHVSVDLNGCDGALRLDLRKPLGLGRFDMVTNFGTTEHVSEQEPVWRNIVEAAGHLIVSTTPKPGTYPGHGLLYPHKAFYIALAVANAFRIERLYERATKKGVLICCRMHRIGEAPFRMPDRSLIVREADRDQYSAEIAKCSQ